MIKMPTGCEFVEIDKLVPYAKNPKNHGDKDVGLIIKSIERNGWGDPLLVCPETMEVLSGNGRLFAGEKLGLEKLPVVYAPAGLSEKQKADLVIASNKLVEISGYNDNLDVLIAEFNLSIDDFGITIPEMDAEMPKLKDGEMGANMYKGVPYSKARLVQEKNARVPAGDGGAVPTGAHQL